MTHNLTWFIAAPTTHPLTACVLYCTVHQRAQRRPGYSIWCWISEKTFGGCLLQICRFIFRELNELLNHKSVLIFHASLVHGPPRIKCQSRWKKQIPAILLCCLLSCHTNVWLNSGKGPELVASRSNVVRNSRKWAWSLGLRRIPAKLPAWSEVLDAASHSRCAGLGWAGRRDTAWTIALTSGWNHFEKAPASATTPAPSPRPPREYTACGPSR